MLTGDAGYFFMTQSVRQLEVETGSAGNAALLCSQPKLQDVLGGVVDVPIKPSERPIVSEAVVRRVLKRRRDRETYFDTDLFADPAWDILLELYAAELRQQRLAVTSVCAAAAVPMTTALRWISLLEGRGLIDRRPDPLDGRRFYLALTRAAREGMEAYFITVIGKYGLA